MKSFLGFLAEASKTQKQEKKIEEPQQQKQPKVTDAEAKEDQVDLEAQEEGEFGTFADGTPRRMAPPTRADGTPKEDMGELTVTRSQDPKKNPYDCDEKVEVMKMMFPDHSDCIVNDPNARTIFDVLKQAHEDGYSSVKIVVGGDRVKEFEKLSGDYNGKLYDFSTLATVSAGERDADSEGVEGMSASKMRKAAADGDLATFRKGLPDTIDDRTAKKMMSTIRKKMNISEGWNLWEIAPKFDWRNLRENYVSGKIFKLDEKVQNLNTGLIGKVIRRGTNYLICVTEDSIMFKSWIRDLCEYTEVKMEKKKRVSGKPNTLVGTGGYFKYAADMTPGFEKGDKTNIQPGGKPYKGPARNIKEFINRYKKKSI
jgi:hypothetical protein